MDDKWFKAKQKARGVTADEIAKKMGRDRSAVSHIYTGQRRMSLEWARAFSEVLGEPIDEILKRAGVYSEAAPTQTRVGFSESDAAPWVPQGGAGARARGVAEILGGDRPGVDVWQIRSDALVLMGYMPGDLMLVDSHQAERCRPGDVVVAQRYSAINGTATTLLRRYEPPVLVAANTTPEDRRVDIVDGSNVIIRGKVTACWRSDK